MIPGDLSAELAPLLASLAAAGTFPPGAAALTANGTWRRARTAAGPSPGRYVTSLPFELASLSARPPHAIATELATKLARLHWVGAAQAAGGYLTITVTPAHLAGLPSRIVAAGPAAARSDALAGLELTAPYPPDLTAMPTWQQAWRAQHAALIGRFGECAGAHVLFFHCESKAAGASAAKADVGDPPAAIAYFGLDPVRFAVAAAPTPRASAIERQLGRPADLTNPFVMIRYARADAASTLRWAADLGLRAGKRRAGGAQGHERRAGGAQGHERRAGGAQGQQGRHAAAADVPILEPPEFSLIDAMSWLPERIAAAHRRRRPADLVRYLEHLARAWLDCSENCSALPFRGRGGSGSRTPMASRLELAEAASTILAAGLGLIEVAAPAMM